MTIKHSIALSLACIEATLKTLAEYLALPLAVEVTSLGDANASNTSMQ